MEEAVRRNRGAERTVCQSVLQYCALPYEGFVEHGIDAEVQRAIVGKYQNIDTIQFKSVDPITLPKPKLTRTT